MRLADTYQRKINYLRLSITDRCNMRCSFCMPEEGVDKLQHADILSYEQFLTIARTAVSLGIEKIRVASDEAVIAQELRRLVNQKPAGHHLNACAAGHVVFSMARIGG